MSDNKHKSPPCTKDIKKCQLEKKVEDSIVINTNCSPSDTQNAAEVQVRRCPPSELVRNGGFEQPGIFEAFAFWNGSTSNFTIRSFDHPYEGIEAAEFISSQTETLTEKTAVLTQEVPVTPGCYLILSFADNFRRAGAGGFDGLDIRASVFYEESGNRVNLITIEIAYSAEADQAGQGYVFHQRASDIPVPPNINHVTVEFFVQVRDVGAAGNSTQWLLDGVSLRAT